MTLSAEFRTRIEEIRNDFTNGSSVIAGNVLKILEDAIKINKNSDRKIIPDIASELLSAKPHMAAPSNILKIFINEFPKLSGQAELLKFIKKLETDMQLASETCIKLAFAQLHIKEKISLLTCSYSSNVFNIISQSGTGSTVYILQSIWNGIDYSEMLQAQLKVLNVKCNVLSEDDKIPEIDFALLGADAVLYSGDIINGKPSLYLAKLVNGINIPLFVVAESFKKCEEIQITDGFELIPNELITDIITDNIFKTRII